MLGCEVFLRAILFTRSASLSFVLPDLVVCYLRPCRMRQTRLSFDAYDVKLDIRSQELAHALCSLNHDLAAVAHIHALVASITHLSALEVVEEM